MATSSTRPAASAWPPTSPAATATVLPRQLLRLRDRRSDVVDEGVGRFGVPAVGLRAVRHHDDVLADGRATLPAVRHVEQVPADDHRADRRPRRPHVVDRRLRHPQLAGRVLTVTDVCSPLPYHSKSGPTWSSSSAMKPSTDTTLCITTLPITSPIVNLLVETGVEPRSHRGQQASTFPGWPPRRSPKSWTGSPRSPNWTPTWPSWTPNSVRSASRN